MSTVGVRELAARASTIVSEVENSGKPTLVTRRGRPVAVLVAVSEDDIYDVVLAKAPEFARDRRDADAAIARGNLGRPLDEVMADLEATGL
ncbi:MAG: type II toxin-antitoxin system Phd/YefM family antitoxin [Mycobacteriales bacterium]